MRTSGRESDIIIFLIPVGALVMLGFLLFGSPPDLIRLLDRTVMEAVYWVANHWS